MQIEKHKIIEILNSLNISYKDDGGDWIKCRCPNPSHIDNNPSAGININTGVFNCFSCGYSKSIIHVIMDNFNCSYNEALNMLDIGIKNTEKKPTINLTQHIKRKKRKEKVKKSFISVKTDISDFEYARLRGFTKEFCTTFNIKLGVSGLYKDYMIIPIVEKEVNAFEARRVMEYEYLLKYFNLEEGNYNYLKEKYKQLQKDEKIIQNEYSYYLNKPKTLYPKNSNINNTLFNYKNLDTNKELYVVEGIGSIPKIWTHITKNVTCIFGAEVTNKQILLLRNFPKIILIPDNDQAGDMTIRIFNHYIKNVYVKKISSDDTEDKYIKEIQNTKEIQSSKLLVRRFFRTVIL